MELTKELKSKGWLATHSALKTASNNHVMMNNLNRNKLIWIFIYHLNLLNLVYLLSIFHNSYFHILLKIQLCHHRNKLYCILYNNVQ